MKGGVLEINWHDSLPVLTLDFHPMSGFLATGGGDHDIKIWVISPCQSPGKTPRVSYKSSLSYHSTPVNTLRFSPSGDHLASGSDGGELALWKLHSDDGETWKILKRLLHHQKDVLDLQWSADGAFLVSGSVDNSCIIWDVQKGSMHQIFDGHMHYVQGVSWDPLGQFIASVSSDRTCRIYMKQLHKSKSSQKAANFGCQHVICKLEPLKPDDSKTPNKFHLFHDETLPSFFRRLAWSPDGSFLIVPAGVHKVSSTSEAINTAYIFSRKDLSRPAVLLPAANKPIVAVRFCPILFQLQGSGSASGFFKLPYRVVFAVATLNSLFVYDTEGSTPIAVFAGLHLAAITDITWSSDAKYLAVSSRDCYCTIVEFEDNELGTPISLQESEKASERASSPIPLKPDPDGLANMDVDSKEPNMVNSTADKKREEEKPVVSAPSVNPTNVKRAKKRITPIAIS